MDAVEWAIFGGMVVLTVGCCVYALIRLMNEPRTGLDPRSQRFARAFGYPRLLDPLLTKPMARREKFGWFIVLAVMVGAIAFTLLTGIGVRQ
jgi:hypothetical protein